MYLGCAAQGRMFTKEIIEKMSVLNKNPIIFALSNPTVKAECTAEEAYQYSNVYIFSYNIYDFNLSQ